MGLRELITLCDSLRDSLLPSAMMLRRNLVYLMKFGIHCEIARIMIIGGNAYLNPV